MSWPGAEVGEDGVLGRGFTAAEEVLAGLVLVAVAFAVAAPAGVLSTATATATAVMRAFTVGSSCGPLRHSAG